MWHAFENGEFLGARGSEQGVIELDEEHPWGVRITLERDGCTAPWSITGGIYGVFAHTAFASSEGEARNKYADMKRDLISILGESPSTPCYKKMRLFADVY